MVKGRIKELNTNKRSGRKKGVKSRCYRKVIVLGIFRGKKEY